MDATLPPALRAELEQRADVQRRRELAHRDWLRSMRLTHAALGAATLVFALLLMSSSLGPRTLLDAALGAAAGVALNALGGGGFRGLALFGGACACSVVQRISHSGLTEAWISLAVFLSVPAFAFAFAAGYWMGMTIASEHFERRWLP